MKTVKVKVFVNVNSSGSWNAGGNDDTDDSTMKEECCYILGSREDTQQGYWIEVELPVPPKKGQVKKESFNVTVTKD